MTDNFLKYREKKDNLIFVVNFETVLDWCFVITERKLEFFHQLVASIRCTHFFGFVCILRIDFANRKSIKRRKKREKKNEFVLSANDQPLSQRISENKIKLNK